MIADSRSTNYLLNSKIPPPDKRPRCTVKGCKKHKAIIGTLKDGNPNYRKVCAEHHAKNIAEKNGVKSMVELTAKRQGMTVSQYAYKSIKKTAESRGYSSVTEYRNTKHPYRKHRKEYCENRDGRLGFKCRCTIRHSAQLQVDHKNGDPSDNRPRNLQTLCANCHIYKTHLNKDYSSPGRKKLKKNSLTKYSC